MQFEQVPGIYHRRLGALLLTALSDGFVDLPADVVRGMAPAEAERVVAEATGAHRLRIGVNAFALRGDGRTVLVDAGSGSTMGPTCGRLPDNLRRAGIEPESVDTVLLTHIHPDHSGGLASDAGEALFPRATVVVHADDLAHVRDDAAMARADARTRTRYFEMARSSLAPYADRIRTFRDPNVMAGVTAIPSPGHTPGHCAYRIRSGDDEVLVLGDAVHVPDLQLPFPEVTMMFDADGTGAARSRRALLDLAVRERLVVCGMHLNFPPFGRLAAVGDGFRLRAEPWAFEV